VYTVPGHDGDDRVYLIRRGRVRAEHERPRSEQDRGRLRELVEDLFKPSERESAQVPAHEIDELLLLSSWFRRFPAELSRSCRAAEFIAGSAAYAHPGADPLFDDPVATPAA